jgi:anti-sigma B factor antagonist
VSKNFDINGNAHIKIVPSNNGALARLSGRFDIDTAPVVCNQLLALLRRASRQTVSIDLSRVTHIDSSGVATLIEALRIARGCNIDLRLQGLNDRLLRLFKVTGILSLFKQAPEQ